MSFLPTTNHHHNIDGHDELVCALDEHRNQLNTSRFGDATSDLTIKCQGREFKVHVLILAPACNFFRGCLAHDTVEANSRVITMADDDPDALESFLKFLYTISIAHIKYRNVVHNFVPGDWFSHIVKVFVLADKYNQPILRSALADLIANEPNCDGRIQCRDPGCSGHWLYLDQDPLDVLEAWGATFEDDFPALDEAPEIKAKLQKGLYNSIRRSAPFMDAMPLDQMSDAQRAVYRRLEAIFKKYNPDAFVELFGRFRLESATLDQKKQQLKAENQRLRQQLMTLGGQP